MVGQVAQLEEIKRSYEVLDYMKERGHLEDLVVDGRVILEWGFSR